VNCSFNITTFQNGFVTGAQVTFIHFHGIFWCLYLPFYLMKLEDLQVKTHD